MAQVILLEKIHSLGDLGEQVTVSNGYARNYLYPKNKAVPANKETIAEFKIKRAELEKIAQEKLHAAETRAAAIADLTITIPVKAAEEGRLYGSVGLSELVRAADAAGVMLEKSEIRLPQGPLRQLGEHEVTVQLHSDVIALLKVNIVAEDNGELKK
ncbi:50S ribosomal protein L9 [Rickettsiella grylli]|uniref:Large ribosomal subunit protein bL9 n=1 Tax=Rickettsiella grylli TaxID=59196 RepID=A8PLH2_9COXI|nr:50S ribosomal protein L9 [Rickettsiella grylli]EDP46309.1 ribosomal protein L9 [Rickettsiella grylli]OIZ99202.1 50S ribosomal protein L9 [Rickettsiella grylli]